jgi:hypothetical protein
MLDDGPDENIDWPAMPATAVLWLAGYTLRDCFGYK